MMLAQFENGQSCDGGKISSSVRTKPAKSKKGGESDGQKFAAIPHQFDVKEIHQQLNH